MMMEQKVGTVVAFPQSAGATHKTAAEKNYDSMERIQNSYKSDEHIIISS